MIDGVSYSFDHLLDFDMSLSRPPREGLLAFHVSIRVVFDCHVVTEAEKPNETSSNDAGASTWIDSGGRRRRFSQSRYAHSRRLPALIRALPTANTRCYVASGHNYMVCERTTSDRKVEYYQVYFDLYRPGHDDRLVLYVQSAYVKDDPTAASRRHAKPFATLCAEKMGLIQKKGPARGLR